MMISLNLPSDYEIKLEQIAHNENITVSEVIKKAVELYLSRLSFIRQSHPGN